MAEYSENVIRNWQSNAGKRGKQSRAFLRRLSRSMPPFKTLLKAHEEVFDKFDCLQCANCCKNSSPVFTRNDTTRIASYLGMKPGEFELKYLVADADGDFIPKSKPCPFLESDHTCKVYDVRPKSCAGYPHTHVREGWERHEALAVNTLVCPAAFKIVEEMQSILDNKS